MHKFEGRGATVYSLFSGTLEDALAAVRHTHARRQGLAVLEFNDVFLPVTLDYTDAELIARYMAQCNWRRRAARSEVEAPALPSCGDMARSFVAWTVDDPGAYYVFNGS